MITAVAAEVCAALLGQAAFYGAEGSRCPSEAPWWTCDELGCRFDRDGVLGPLPATDAADRSRIFFERLQTLNSQGFHDEEEFEARSGERTAFRILALGDSFNFGFYAPYGEGWLEVLDSELRERGDVSIWNTAIPGVSTVQEAALMQHFLPLQEPDLVIASFYPANDLDGNLMPIDGMYALDSGGLVPRYRLGAAMTPVALTLGEAVRRATGIRPFCEANLVESALGRTHFGSWLIAQWSRTYGELEWLWSEEARRRPGKEEKTLLARSRTRELLGKMRELAERSDVGLLLVLIPSPLDLQEPSERYRVGLEVVTELSIDFIELRDELEPTDYFPGDEHWTAAGHHKVARRVAAHLVDTEHPTE